MLGMAIRSISLCLLLSGVAIGVPPVATEPLTSDPFSATLITLKLDHIPAREALYRLSKQSRYAFNPAPQAIWNGENGPDITLACENEPFWSCLQQICMQAKLRVVRSGPGVPVELAINDARSVPSPYAVAGPYLFKMAMISNSGRIKFDAVEDLTLPSSCAITLTVCGEPNAPTAAWAIDTLQELVADNVPRQFPPHFFFHASGQTLAKSPVLMLLNIDPPAASINLLRAEVHFVLAAKTEQFVVPNVLSARKVEKNIAGYIHQITPLKDLAKGRYSMEMNLLRGEHSEGDFAAFRQLISTTGTRLLLDAQNQPLFSAGGSSTTTSADALMHPAEFSRQMPNKPMRGEPARFVWNVPTEMKTATFQIAFKNVPLPPMRAK